MKLGFLGPKGTFSHEAAKIYSPKSQLIEYRTITEVILGLKNDETNQAIVPIENSIQGGVTETVDCLIETDDIFVNREIVVKIQHNLMANKYYTYHEIKEIYSHPQALAQCRKFTEKNFKNVQIIPTSSTAVAAQKVNQKDFCACIAGRVCAEEYELCILTKNIQSNDINQTKFWVLSKNINQNGNKMSLIFSTKNEVGALCNVLNVLSNCGINLTKIESRPAKTSLGTYIFLIDLEVNKETESAITLMKSKCKYVKILGIY